MPCDALRREQPRQRLDPEPGKLELIQQAYRHLGAPARDGGDVAFEQTRRVIRKWCCASAAWAAGDRDLATRTPGADDREHEARAVPVHCGLLLRSFFFAPKSATIAGSGGAKQW